MTSPSILRKHFMAPRWSAGFHAREQRLSLPGLERVKVVLHLDAVLILCEAKHVIDGYGLSNSVRYFGASASAFALNSACAAASSFCVVKLIIAWRSALFATDVEK
jgi:hypothetical protein